MLNPLKSPVKGIVEIAELATIEFPQPGQENRGEPSGNATSADWSVAVSFAQRSSDG
jgi:hypothetical protein